MDTNYEFQKPGRIVEYFPATQTATVKICNDRTYSTSEVDEEQVTPGLLYDVPVHTPSGGGWAMTFPIEAGEPCLLSFSQFGYDHWFVNNSDSAGVDSDGSPQPWTRRRFDLADCFAQVGFNNLQTVVSDYQANHSEWRNEDRTTRIALMSSGQVQIISGSTSIQVLPSGDVIIMAPEVSMSGDLQVDGDLNVGGTITTPTSVTTPSAIVDGKELGGHTHSQGNDSGGDSQVNTGVNN